MFTGRLSRKNFALGALLSLGFGFALLMVSVVFSTLVFSDSSAGGLMVLTGMLYVVGGVLIQLFTVTLAVRRLHDLGYTGWLVLLLIVPLVNFVFALYLFLAQGDEGTNVYGEPNGDKPWWPLVWGTLQK